VGAKAFFGNTALPCLSPSCLQEAQAVLGDGRGMRCLVSGTRLRLLQIDFN
jgi:hypothetical protein